jgi:hypothetical protein
VTTKCPVGPGEKKDIRGKLWDSGEREDFGNNAVCCGFFNCERHGARSDVCSGGAWGVGTSGPWSLSLSLFFSEI